MLMDNLDECLLQTSVNFVLLSHTTRTCVWRDGRGARETDHEKKRHGHASVLAHGNTNQRITRHNQRDLIEQCEPRCADAPPKEVWGVVAAEVRRCGISKKESNEKSVVNQCQGDFIRRESGHVWVIDTFTGRRTQKE